MSAPNRPDLQTAGGIERWSVCAETAPHSGAPLARKREDHAI